MPSFGGAGMQDIMNNKPLVLDESPINTNLQDDYTDNEDDSDFETPLSSQVVKLQTSVADGASKNLMTDMQTMTPQSQYRNSMVS